MLLTIKMNYKGYGEYSLLDPFVVGTFPLDPHSHGHPTFQQAKKATPPLQK